MIRNVSLKIYVILLPVAAKEPPNVLFIVLKLVRGEKVFHTEGDTEVVLIQIRILTYL